MRWISWCCLLLSSTLSAAEASQRPSSASLASQAARRADLGLGELSGYRKPTTQRLTESTALAHYATALQLERTGKSREALDHYLEAVKADPTHPEVAVHAAELALSYINRQRAVQILEDCCKAAPESPEAAINLANFYATYPPEAGQGEDKTVQVVKNALARFPASAEVYRAATMIFLTRNLRTGAEEAMAQAMRQPSTSPDFWLVTGRAAQEVWPLAHSEQKLIHRAKVNPFFENALKNAPAAKRSDVHLDVAQYFLLSAQVDRSGEIVEALYKSTGDLQAARLLVRILQARDKDPEAIALLEKVIKTAPDDVEQRRLAAGIYTEQREFAKAVPHLEAIIRIAGGSVDDYRVLANLLLFSGAAEKALALTQRTRVLFPNDASFLLVAARACSALKRYEETVQHYAKAEMLAQATSPEDLDDDFYSEWGNALQNLKLHDEAARKYQRAISLVPQENPKRAAMVLNNLGYMWLDLNQNIDKAGDFIRRACEFDPESYIYKDSLGWFHFRKGNYQEALKVLLEAEKMIKVPEAGDAEIIDHIAQVYEKLSNKDKAREYYEKALKLDPTNTTIQLHLKALAPDIGS
ncbi:MAG: tetratricopeptide repeat protein [Verrucomicrobiaceae bacterium]|nr:tetratricopeptide repeat protein [Verrucomicrobiaceae bacterium]